MGAADLFVFLSRQEGQGTVTVEAMACGLPCVVSPLDGISRELLPDGLAGVVVDRPDDADAVAASMLELLAKPDHRREMGRVGREHAVERYSIARRADLLAELYRAMRGASATGAAAG